MCRSLTETGQVIPRWGKRNVVSFHFTELVLEITEMAMLPISEILLIVLLGLKFSDTF